MKLSMYSVFSFLFLFLFRCNSKKNATIIISKAPFSKLLDISYIQSYQQLQSTLTVAFRRHLSIEDFIRTWINTGACFSWVNIMKQKWAKIPWKLLVAQKSKPVLWRTLLQDISIIIVFFFLTEANLQSRTKYLEQNGVIQ